MIKHQRTRKTNCASMFAGKTKEQAEHYLPKRTLVQPIVLEIKTGVEGGDFRFAIHTEAREGEEVPPLGSVHWVLGGDEAGLGDGRGGVVRKLLRLVCRARKFMFNRIVPEGDGFKREELWRCAVHLDPASFRGNRAELIREMNREDSCLEVRLVYVGAPYYALR